MHLVVPVAVAVAVPASLVALPCSVFPARALSLSPCRVSDSPVSTQSNPPP
ncbi:hypothetical protein KC19_3G265000 [Ceratodon purpureus]|uniref:Secreted peptide n=1 Tax=Ceratodon purpureus TaxID=3225 RepID=A0A8T0IQ96_CERPU|nr:hypothetical protein KC19_3G265000 [Ceratodon purpureus]